MQQAACHLLSTAEIAAMSSSPSSSLSISSAVTHAALNHMGQSKILHLLGPPWTRTFRCLWMLEEINEEYYQNNNKNNNFNNNSNSSKTKSDAVLNDPDLIYQTTSTVQYNNHISSTQQQQQQQIPYYLVYNAKPLSIHVKKYHPTGKVPVLLEYDIPRGTGDLWNTTGSSSEQSTTTTAMTNNNDVQLDDQNVFVLSESSAINTYLYDRYGLYNTRSGIDERQLPRSSASTTTEESFLLNDHNSLVPPVGSPLRGQYDALVSCICTELDAQGLWIHRKHDAMAQQLTGSRPNHRAVFHAKDHFKRINTYLAYRCNPYLLGSHFTAADILYVHCLQWSQTIGWSTDTWPTVYVLPPINVDTIKQDKKKKLNKSGTTDNDPTPDNNLLSPSILQPYLDLCLSRPAYHRAVQIRDGNNNSRTTTTNTNHTNATTITTTLDHHQQEQKSKL